MSGSMPLEFLSVATRAPAESPKPVTDTSGQGVGRGKAFADQLRDADANANTSPRDAGTDKDADAATDLGPADARGPARDTTAPRAAGDAAGGAAGYRAGAGTEMDARAMGRTSDAGNRQPGQASASAEVALAPQAPPAGSATAEPAGTRPGAAAAEAAGSVDTAVAGTQAGRTDAAVAGQAGEVAPKRGDRDTPAGDRPSPTDPEAALQTRRAAEAGVTASRAASESDHRREVRSQPSPGDGKSAPEGETARTGIPLAGDRASDQAIRVDAPRMADLAVQADGQRAIAADATPGALAGDAAARALTTGTDGLSMGDAPLLATATAPATATAQATPLQTALAAGPASSGAPVQVTAAPGDLPALVQQTLAAGEDRPDRIVVQLDPPELGRVSIDFKFDAQGLQHVTITGENPDAMRQLRNLHFELIQALERNGLSGQDMSFHQDSQSGSGRHEADLARLRAGLLETDEPRGPGLPASARQAPDTPIRLTPSGGLDLRL